jgi:hypothetical protein
MGRVRGILFITISQLTVGQMGYPEELKVALEA